MGDNMLRKFKVSNYKNFNDEVIVDFTNKHDYQYNQYCVKDDLISKMLVLGTNASGKSNLGYALFDIVLSLTDNQTNEHQTDELSFLNGYSNKKYASFSYEFSNGKKIILFEYKKTRPTEFLEESLFIDGQLVYTYNYKNSTGNFENMNLINADTLTIESIESSLSVLRFIANNSNQQEDSDVNFIINFAKNMLWFRATQDGNAYIGLLNGRENINQYIINNNLLNEFESFLRELGDIEIRLKAAKVETLPESESILVQIIGKQPVIFNEVASSGTKALELLFFWNSYFDKISFLFIDEFDAFYHYELSKKVLKFIAELNNVQAMLTSHNTSLISNTILRPDCYLNISNGKVAPFTSLTNRELRVVHNLEKMYRNGEFNE